MRKNNFKLYVKCNKKHQLTDTEQLGLFAFLSFFILFTLQCCYFNTFKPLCNKPSGIYILSGFLKRTLICRQFFHHVAPFCGIAVSRSSKIHKRYILGISTSSTCRVKINISGSAAEVQFSLGEREKTTGLGFTGSGTDTQDN